MIQTREGQKLEVQFRHNTMTPCVAIVACTIVGSIVRKSHPTLGTLRLPRFNLEQRVKPSTLPVFACTTRRQACTEEAGGWILATFGQVRPTTRRTTTSLGAGRTVCPGPLKLLPNSNGTGHQKRGKRGPTVHFLLTIVLQQTSGV